VVVHTKSPNLTKKGKLTLGLARTLKAIADNEAVDILSSKLHRDPAQFFCTSHKSGDSCQLPWKKIKSKEVKTSAYSCTLPGQMCPGAREISAVTGVLGPHSITAALGEVPRWDVDCPPC